MWIKCVIYILIYINSDIHVYVEKENEKDYTYETINVFTWLSRLI